MSPWGGIRIQDFNIYTGPLQADIKKCTKKKMNKTKLNTQKIVSIFQFFCRAILKDIF